MPFIKHGAYPKVVLHYRMILFSISKVGEFLLLSHDHVCNIMCIKPVGMAKNCIASLCISCGYTRKKKGVRSDSLEVIIIRQHA